MSIIGNAGKAREVQAVASGVLPNGKPVVVNADGTVSSIGVASDSATTSATYNSSNIGTVTSALDTSTGKIMIRYGDNSHFLVMATISGSSVSFGTPTAISTWSSGDLSYDEASGHFLLVYQGSSNYGRARVASLSGTNITVSTELVWASNVTSRVVLSYDPVHERHVSAYMNEGSNRLEARVFRINGTTPVAHSSGTTLRSGPNTHNAICYDPDSGYHVTTYMDYVGDNYAQKGRFHILRVSPGSSYMAIGNEGSGVFANEAVKNGGRDGTAVVYDTINQKYAFAYVANNGQLKMLVGTLAANNTFSFGSTTVIASDSGGAGTRFKKGMVFDPTSGKIIVTYDRSNTSGRITTAKISGTSITSTSTTTFNSATTRFFTTTYSPSTKSALVFYQDGGNSNYGTYVVFTPGATNLTSENYIGLAASDTPDGKAAKINIKGAVDDNQSGLTAGQSYYISPTNGTLGTTPANPSVFAGTAVSANKLIVKG